MTPSGSCVIRSSICCLASAWTFSSRSARRGLGEEEVDPAEKAVELVLRLPDRLSHFARQRARERLVHRDDPLAKPGDRFEALADRNLRPAALAGARGLVLAFDRRGVVGGDVGDDDAGGGIDDLHVGSVLALAREGIVRTRR